MPVERVPTPRPILRKPKQCTDQYENAKRFINELIKFIVKSKDMYKFCLFIYMTLMILFVIIVDNESYDMKHMGTEVFGLVIMIELALGAVCICAVIGVIHGNAFFVAPLLFLHVCVLIYGFFYYMCPFVLVKQTEAFILIEENSSKCFVMKICAQMALIIVIRLVPLFVQTFMIGFIIRIIFSLLLIKRVESKHFLPVRTNSATNTHVWSSIRRKISSRHVLDTSTQTPQSRILPDPDLICEMSAKFRNAKFPQPAIPVVVVQHV